MNMFNGMDKYIYSDAEGQHVVQFINGCMFIDDVTFRVVEDVKREHAYKVQKTAIKATDGVAGLERLLADDRIIGASRGSSFVHAVLQAYRQDKIRGRFIGAKKAHLFSQLAEG